MLRQHMTMVIRTNWERFYLLLIMFDTGKTDLDELLGMTWDYVRWIYPQLYDRFEKWLKACLRRKGQAVAAGRIRWEDRFVVPWFDGTGDAPRPWFGHMHSEEW